MWFIICSILGVLSAAKIAKSANPIDEDYVIVRARGTRLNIVPNAVIILTSDPGGAAKRFVENRKDEAVELNRKTDAQKAARVVGFHGIEYRFVEPKVLNDSLRGAKVSDGDVVYVYECDSQKQKESRVDKYKLKVCADVIENGAETAKLYEASPKHFVLLVVRTSKYTCPIHSDVLLESAGKCPKCGLPLGPVEIRSRKQ
jgi:hypothetical protein